MLTRTVKNQGAYIQKFCTSTEENFLLLEGDAFAVLKEFPSDYIDTCITSPPYWLQRKYDKDSDLGSENNWKDYVKQLARIFREVKRVLKPEGSLWLNIGDTYLKKNLCGIPWRVSFALQEDGWILRNAVIWNKMKGNPCNAKDKLRNMYENVFHFVTRNKYYYNVDEIRTPPRKPYYRNGRIVTPTGVSGLRYREQIICSRVLNKEEKENALKALDETLRKVEQGDIPDFRMIIRGQQRSIHSDSPEFSGRASELQARGFCILPYHKNGSKPGNIWNIIPEDRQRKDKHYAVFPIELCEIPIKSTCPKRGIVLDPFTGTGTTIAAAVMMGRRGVGIDVSLTYLNQAEKRVNSLTHEMKQDLFKKEVSFK